MNTKNSYYSVKANKYFRNSWYTQLNLFCRKYTKLKILMAAYLWQWGLYLTFQHHFCHSLLKHFPSNPIRLFTIPLISFTLSFLVYLCPPTGMFFMVPGTIQLIQYTKKMFSQSWSHLQSWFALNTLKLNSSLT